MEGRTATGEVVDPNLSNVVVGDKAAGWEVQEDLGGLDAPVVDDLVDHRSIHNYSV